MKRTALRGTAPQGRKIPATPARSRSGKGAPRADPADTFDDRVSESLVDYEDEREAVEVVTQGAMRSAN